MHINPSAAASGGAADADGGKQQLRLRQRWKQAGLADGQKSKVNFARLLSNHGIVARS
jgi:hypothetical protein